MRWMDQVKAAVDELENECSRKTAVREVTGCGSSFSHWNVDHDSSVKSITMEKKN